MQRPRWHDFVIVLAILGLLVTGVMALWGDDIRGWMGHDAQPPASAEPPARAPAPDPGVGGGA